MDARLGAARCAGTALSLLVLFGLAGGAGCRGPDGGGAAPSAADAPLAADAYDAAVRQIIASGRSDDPASRARAIEAARPLKDRILQLAQLGLADEHEAVRFNAVVAVGRLRLTPLVPSVRALGSDASPSVRAAVMLALRRCDAPVDVASLGALAGLEDPTVRGNVALLLGLLGEPSDRALLRVMARQPPSARIRPVERAIVRIQIAEAMVRLGDQTQRETIRAWVYSEFGEVRVLAVQMLGELGDRAYQDALLPMLGKDPVELRLAAAESMARMGDERGFEVVRRAGEMDMPLVRSQAAMALGWFRGPAAAAARWRLLADPVEPVRLGAAAAIVRAGSAASG